MGYDPTDRSRLEAPLPTSYVSLSPGGTASRGRYRPGRRPSALASILEVLAGSRGRYQSAGVAPSLFAGPGARRISHAKSFTARALSGPSWGYGGASRPCVTRPAVNGLLPAVS